MSCHWSQEQKLQKLTGRTLIGSFHELTGLWCADDSALVRLRGTTATTNFPLLDYRSDLAAYHKLQQV